MRHKPSSTHARPCSLAASSTTTPAGTFVGRISTGSIGRWTGSTSMRPATLVARSGWSRTMGRDVAFSFAELSARSNRVANFLRRLGARRGDRLLLMLPNVAPMWEILLARHEARRGGRADHDAARQARTSPTAWRAVRFATSSTDADGAEKLQRPGRTVYAARGRRGAAGLDCLRRGGSRARHVRARRATTTRGDPLLLYFTSGTTAKPKLVLHTHQSYPVGHLSTMYWIGLREGDVHWNISSPGWAKHAWSSIFAPWNAGATVFVYDYARFDARSDARDDRALRRDDALRAADRLAHAGRRGSRRLSGRACARSWARASRSIPRSSSACGARGASRFATGTARPRRRRRSATRRASP